MTRASRSVKAALTAERLRSLIQYRPLSGEFEWRASRHGVCAHQVAGSIDAEGYRRINVDGRRYRAARLAVLWMTGAWPDGVVDHINGCRDDDRWANLRVVPPGVNACNRWTARSASGVLGVFRAHGRRPWRAAIGHNGRDVHLGTFDSVSEAHEAYALARIRVELGGQP